MKAEIHFNLKWKKLYMKERKRQTALKCFVLLPHSGSQIELKVKDSLADWISFEALPVVKTVRKLSSQYQGHFEVAFGRVKHDGRLKLLPNDRVVRQHQPFLLVFSDDSDMVDKTGLKSLLDETENIDKSDDEELQHYRNKRDLQRNPSYYAYSVEPTEADRPGSNNNNEDKWRNKVQRFDKKVPKVTIEKKDQKAKTENPKKLIPKGRYYHPKKFGLKLPKKPKDRNFPFAWLQRPLGLSGDGQDGIYLKSHHQIDTCKKRELIVEFSDIGWGDWIISPKSFEAHFCSGSCPFPLTKVNKIPSHFFSSFNLAAYRRQIQQITR